MNLHTFIDDYLNGNDISKYDEDLNNPIIISRLPYIIRDYKLFKYLYDYLRRKGKFQQIDMHINKDEFDDQYTKNILDNLIYTTRNNKLSKFTKNIRQEVNDNYNNIFINPQSSKIFRSPQLNILCTSTDVEQIGNLIDETIDQKSKIHMLEKENRDLQLEIEKLQKVNYYK